MLDVEATSCYSVICCAPVGAVTTVPLLPNAVWLGESSRNSCLSWPLDTSHPEYMAFVWLCSMVAKRGDQRNPRCGSSATMTVPWSIGFMSSKTETKHPQLHHFRNFPSRTLHLAFAVGNSDSMAMYEPCPLSNLSQTFRFPALERKEGPEKLGLNVWRLMSKSVA